MPDRQRQMDENIIERYWNSIKKFKIRINKRHEHQHYTVGLEKVLKTAINPKGKKLITLPTNPFPLQIKYKFINIVFIR